MSFSKEFVWGAATSAHQIEGAAYEDGKGESIWDVYAHDDRIDLNTNKRNIINGDNADIACNHYHLFKEDVALMSKMGLKAYRFSISWTRILPNGKGEINQEGIRFYSELVDELLRVGIEPYITLFHWDLPQALQNIGGWANPKMPDIFAKYVRTVVEVLSDRVKYWMTINEPQCHIIFGHIEGTCAPKLRLSYKEAFRIMHNLFLAHGKAVKQIRKHAILKPKVGFAPNPVAFYPFNDTIEDLQATKKMAFQIKDKNFWNTRWWLDPVILGEYPKEGIELFGNDFPKDMIKDGDMEIISQSIDFIGCNFYTGTAITVDKKGNPTVAPQKNGYDRTAFKWEVTPKILRYMPRFIWERYKLPIYITENGLSMVDWVCLDGKVHDIQRIDFMHKYLIQLHKAISDGVPILGYFAWSFMDNYEWSNGYDERFGLIHIDYETQKRTFKDSAYWYADLIKNDGNIIE